MSKINIFIDGNNIFHSSKNAGINLDYELLRKYIADDRKIGKIFFYTGIDDTVINDDQKKFILWLKRHGFTVTAKPIKNEVNNKRYVSYYPEMITDMFFFNTQAVDTIAIVGGGEALVYPIQRLSDSGLRVELYGYNDSVSNKLLDIVDQYYSLDGLEIVAK